MGFKSSVALRLAVWFLLLSIFPLAVVAIFVIDDVSAGFTELTLDHRRSQAELLAASLGRLSLTETASILPEISHGRYKAIFIVAKDLGQTIPGITLVCLGIEFAIGQLRKGDPLP